MNPLILVTYTLNPGGDQHTDVAVFPEPISSHDDLSRLCRRSDETHRKNDLAGRDVAAFRGTKRMSLNVYVTAIAIASRYPEQSIRLVIPYPRPIAEAEDLVNLRLKMSQAIGQEVIEIVCWQRLEDEPDE